jgi:hypothetical protein
VEVSGVDPSHHAKYVMATPPLKIHGRSALTATITFKDPAGNLVDLSGKALFVEIANGKIRKALLPGSTPTQRILHLSREEVATVPATQSTLTLLDESVPGDEGVVGERMIQRVGYVVK